MGTARDLPATDSIAEGKGLIDLAAAKAAPTPNVTQNWERSTGSGSLEQARGSHHVKNGTSELTGEVDWTGGKWNAGSVAKALREDTSLLSGLVSTTGLSWSGLSWSGLSWSGLSWSGLSWSGLSWSGLSWSGLSWSGLSWSGLSWSGLSWSGLSWSGLSWS
jgi:serine protease AprX